MSFGKNPVLMSLALVAACTAWSRPSKAAENLSPYLPGVSTGVPVGAAPPPGFYLVDTMYTARGNELKDGKGNGTPLKLRNYVNTTMFLWVPDWHVLGAQFSANTIVLYARHDVDSTAIGGYRSRSSGFFNLIVTPASLSWNLGNGLFTSASLAFYVPGGNYGYAGGKTLQTSYANDFWTVEPSWAISYLHDGWNFTLNNVFDINKRNSKTDYLSGNAYYLDATATKEIGRWTIGAVGNYSRQFSDDRQYGRVVGDGNRFEHVLVGPLVGYELGKAHLTLRYLQDVRTRNDVNISFAFVSLSFKI
ncbi:SphA family protein [Dyella sedimenti]|uniref:SphA family protein n=1 Tax=Dyella sedimenti TaxID=2919947 RepID=UPI001FAA0A12|nr:transporter [Dyella sedimenti]